MVCNADSELSRLKRENERLHDREQSRGLNLLRALCALRDRAAVPVTVIRKTAIVTDQQSMPDARSTFSAAPTNPAGRQRGGNDCGQARGAGERPAKRTGVAIEDGARWHDLHIEPLRNDSQDIVGITCAAVDVTSLRKARISACCCAVCTGRKNLLAVIQAIARQTAP
jgi:hypothetical protein